MLTNEKLEEYFRTFRLLDQVDLIEKIVNGDGMTLKVDTPRSGKYNWINQKELTPLYNAMVEYTNVIRDQVQMFYINKEDKSNKQMFAVLMQDNVYLANNIFRKRNLEFCEQIHKQLAFTIGHSEASEYKDTSRITNFLEVVLPSIYSKYCEYFEFSDVGGSDRFSYFSSVTSIEMFKVIGEK